MSSINLSHLDIIIFVIIMALTIVITIYGNLRTPNKKHGALDILLAGRKLTLVFFVPCLVVTWYGGILGVTQISYEHGIYNFITQGVFWYISYFIFGFFMVNRLRKTTAISLAELCEKLFGKSSRKIAALFNIFNLIPATYSLSLAIVFNTLFGWGYLNGIVISTVIVAGYISIGGFKSVIITDLFQFFLMSISVLMVVGFSYFQFGGWEFLKNNLPDSHFSVTGGLPIGTLVLWGLLAFSTLVDPNFYHRVFAAIDDKTAKIGILISIAIWMIFDIATTAGGMYARAILQDAQSKNAYLEYSLNLLPYGLKGLFLAGLVATIISTLDSYLFLSAGSISYDLQNKNKNFLLSFRTNLIIVSLLSIVLAMVFSGNQQGSNGIKDLWKTFGSYSSGCLLVPMVYGLIKKTSINEKFFICSTVFSALSITGYRLYFKKILAVNLSPIFNDIDSIYIGILSSFLMIVVFYFIDKKPQLIVK